MVRQAHFYLVGAVSGMGLIAAAVIAFVLLVSAQAFRDWPLSGLPDLGGDGGLAGSIESGKAVTGGGATPGPGAAAGGGTPAGKAAGGTPKSPAQRGAASQPGGVAGSPANGSPIGGSPAGSPPADSPGPGSAPTGGPAPSGSPGSGTGGGQTSGGGKGGGSSTSGQVTGAVNDTVSGVDKATGGALGNTGVPEVTEEAVNGVAGPNSTVGKTVDEAGETVGGLLGVNG